MLKKCIVIAMLALTGCVHSQSFTKYSINNQEVSLGMNTSDVRNVAGTPSNVHLPSALSKAMFPNGVYDNMTKGQQYWQYGNNGDKGLVSITFTDGVVTQIQKFD